MLISNASFIRVLFFIATNTRNHWQYNPQSRDRHFMNCSTHQSMESLSRYGVFHSNTSLNILSCDKAFSENEACFCTCTCFSAVPHSSFSLSLHDSMQNLMLRPQHYFRDRESHNSEYLNS